MATTYQMMDQLLNATEKDTTILNYIDFSPIDEMNPSLCKENIQLIIITSKIS